MGRVLIDLSDLRSAAVDLRRSTGAVDGARASVGSALRRAWLGPEGQRFHQDWAVRERSLGGGVDAIRAVAVRLEQYVDGVVQEQGRSFRAPVPWVLRPSRRLIPLPHVVPLLDTVRALTRVFGSAKQLLAEMLRLLRRGLLRMQGRLAAWTRSVWGWLGKAGSVFTVAAVALLVAPLLPGMLSGALALGTGLAAVGALLFLLRPVGGDLLWRAYAQRVPARIDTERSSKAGSVWGGLRRDGESVLDRACRWLDARPPEGFAPGEFAIVDRGNGQVLVVMRGLDLGATAGNSLPEVGLEQLGFGPYSAQIEAELVRLQQKYPDLTVSFVGHSEGGMASRNVVAQNLGRLGIRVGTVVSIDSPVDGRAIPPSIDPSDVYQFNNVNSPVSHLDGAAPGGGSIQGDNRVEADSTGGHSSIQFVGGQNMTAEQRTLWERAGRSLGDFDELLPGGSVRVYGR